MAKAKRPPQTRKKLGGARIGDGGPREDKARAVTELQERFDGSSAVLLTEYRGMTVGELAELRAALREGGTEYRIFKNTLATIAARNAGLEDLVRYFEGPTAFAFASGDPVLAAKKLSEFARRVPTLVLKGGVLEGRVLSPSDITQLATLESREVMLAKAAGMFLSPIQKLANLFAAPLNQLGAVLAQLRDKLPADGAAPAPADAPAAEAPKADAPEADAPAAEAPTAEAPTAESPEAESPAPEPAAEAPEADAPAADADAPAAAAPAEEASEGADAAPEAAAETPAEPTTETTEG